MVRLVQTLQIVIFVSGVYHHWLYKQLLLLHVVATFLLHTFQWLLLCLLLRIQFVPNMLHLCEVIVLNKGNY